jgi:hypothetical protein
MKKIIMKKKLMKKIFLNNSNKKSQNIF